MGKDWKKYYKYEKKQNQKWTQKEGTNCDDIVFSNGEIEVDFETWLEMYYN